MCSVLTGCRMNLGEWMVRCIEMNCEHVHALAILHVLSNSAGIFSIHLIDWLLLGLLTQVPRSPVPLVTVKTTVTLQCYGESLCRTAYAWGNVTMGEWVQPNASHGTLSSTLKHLSVCVWLDHVICFLSTLGKVSRRRAQLTHMSSSHKRRPPPTHAHTLFSTLLQLYPIKWQKIVIMSFKGAL